MSRLLLDLLVALFAVGLLAGYVLMRDRELATACAQIEARR